MKETYKGYEIAYQEYNEAFSASIGDGSYENESLIAVKKYIDNLDKKNFERVDVIAENWRNDYRPGIVTSCIKDKYGGADCWVSFKGKNGSGSRSKLDINRVYLDNESNKIIFDKIKAKQKNIENLNAEIKELKSGLENYKPEEKP